MMVKKILGVIGVLACIALLVAVGVRAISWMTFWISVAIIAAFAYLVLPRMR